MKNWFGPKSERWILLDWSTLGVRARSYTPFPSGRPGLHEHLYLCLITSSGSALLELSFLTSGGLCPGACVTVASC